MSGTSKVGSMPPSGRPSTLPSATPQQYARAGPPGTQKKFTFENGASLQYGPEDLVTEFDPSQHAFTDQVALIDSAIHSVKETSKQTEDGKVPAQGASADNDLDDFRTNPLDRHAVKVFKGAFGSDVQVPSKFASIGNLVSVYASPNKSAVPGINHPEITSNRKVAIEKAIVAVATEITTPVAPKQPPTEPKADRDRKNLQNAKAEEKQRATVERPADFIRRMEEMRGRPRVDGGLSVGRMPVLNRALHPETTQAFERSLAAGRRSTLEREKVFQGVLNLNAAPAVAGRKPTLERAQVFPGARNLSRAPAAARPPTLSRAPVPERARVVNEESVVERIQATQRVPEGARVVNEERAVERVEATQRVQAIEAGRTVNRAVKLVTATQRGEVIEAGQTMNKAVERVPVTQAGQAIKAGQPMNKDSGSRQPVQGHLPPAAPRDMRCRRAQQIYGPPAGVQPNPRGRPGQQRRRNFPNVQVTNGRNAPNNITIQPGPSIRPQEQPLANRAREERFAREISKVAVVMKQTSEAAIQGNQVRAARRREEIQAKQFADQTINHIERQVQILQDQARATGQNGGSHLAPVPFQPPMMFAANGLVNPMTQQPYLMGHPMFPQQLHPGLPPGFFGYLPPGMQPSFPPGHPAQFANMIPAPLFSLPPGMPPPPPLPPMLAAIPQPMSLPVFHPMLSPPAPAVQSLSNQEMYSLSQQNLCDLVDIHADERRRNPVRFQGAGRLEYEKEQWAQRMIQIKTEDLDEEKELELIDPRKGQRVSQINGAHRFGPSHFMPPSFSISPKPEVVYDEKRLKDPLPEQVPMSGSTSEMSTPTLSYRKLHGQHRLNVQELSKRLQELVSRPNSRPEQKASRPTPLSSPFSFKRTVTQGGGGIKAVKVGATNGAGRNISAPVHGHGKANAGAKQGNNRGKDPANLARKGLISNTIFGQAPGNVSRQQSPSRGRAGGRRGRRLFERSPIRTPPNRPQKAQKGDKIVMRCGNLSPEWDWHLSEPPSGGDRNALWT